MDGVHDVKEADRELRILRKRLDKARQRQSELEDLMDASHTFQRNIIKEVEASRAEIVAKSRELEAAYTSLKAEQARTDQLLRSIMPDDVAAELKSTGRVQPRRGDAGAAVQAQAVAAVGNALERVVDGHQLGRFAFFQRKRQVAFGISLGPVVALVFARFGGGFGTADPAAALCAQLRQHLAAHLLQLGGESVGNVLAHGSSCGVSRGGVLSVENILRPLPASGVDTRQAVPRTPRENAHERSLDLAAIGRRISGDSPTSGADL
jgi:hypothetical protein